MDMNDVRDIILQWERGFDSEEEKMFFYMKYHLLHSSHHNCVTHNSCSIDVL